MEKEKEIFIDYLKKLMEELPEQRIGQILYNYILYSDKDIFFIADEEINMMLEDKLDNIITKKQERKIKKILSENPHVKKEILEILKKYE